MSEGLGAVVRITEKGTHITRGMQIKIENLAQTQQYFMQLAGAISGHSLETRVAKATLRAHLYATKIVHVDTGRLKNSLYPRIQARGNTAYGIVGTNVAYAFYEHERGGKHAFFERTVKEEGPVIVQQFNDDVAREVKR